MMSKRAWTVAFFFSVCLSLAFSSPSQAFYIDEAKTFEVSAKLQTRASLRTQDTDSEANGRGWCYPDIDAGEFVQHRNLALVEIDHDLQNLTKTLDVLYPFRALEINTKYHIVGRFVYDGIYDYGPEILRDVRDADKENVDSFKQSYDLWECYLDLSRGPVFFRIGKQNLAWGETDIFRLLDGINPLDNSFGGIFEDLDDRRIPLWMLRSSVNLGYVGPVSSFTLEGFLVPGKIDSRVSPSPWLPDGSPYGGPVPRQEYPMYRNITPDRTWAESRWGVRAQGLLGSNLNVAVAHYQSYLDTPVPRTVIQGNPEILADLNALNVYWEYPEVRVTGGSLNYWEPMLDFVLRAEFACFWKHPLFIPDINMASLRGEILPLPDWVLDALPGLIGTDIRDIGLYGLPLNPKSGTIARKDVLKYMIGFDKQIWIRPLNRTNMFFVTGQYFGQYVPDYDSRLRYQVHPQDSLKEFLTLRRFEHVFTAMVNTLYMKGNLQPQIAAAYDVRGAVLLQPSINYIREPFRFMIQYSTIFGNFINFGVFRDRDQVTFILTYLLS